ncbi:MAG TPA: hypothetical protein VJL89_11620 [Thermodesulfovibrionia bacterium]|nr:hypothetical protein [Thermodesulfovibrionia bacterium]
MAELENKIGRNKKAFVEIDGKNIEIAKGMEVEAYPGKKSVIAAIFHDLFGNETYITEFHLNDHIGAKGYAEKAGNLISEMLMNPHCIVLDKEKGALLYGVYVDSDKRYYFTVVGQQSRKIFTVERKAGFFENTERYVILYQRLQHGSKI